MPKRSINDDSDEYICRKIRKLEKILRKRKKRPRRISSSSSESGNNCPSPVLSQLEDSQETAVTHLEPNVEPFEPALSGSAECNLDDNILELLGASPSNSKTFGDNIQKDIALRWEHIATSGLTKEARKELLNKHLIPGNCPKLVAPLLNPEIKAASSDTLIGKDRGTEFKQNQIASVISCIGEALTKMFNSEYKETSVIKPLLESAQLLCDLQFSESMKRRSIICTSIKKDIKSQLYETEIDTFLFGEQLADTLKAAKAISKSGSEIKAPRSKVPSRVQSRNLNSKPPRSNSRQPAKRRQDPATYSQAPAA
ncbi:uncharacterized protein LOC124542648 [Vanessa cardui]|uniref:uncharacterized protein LOC124542648 n=1 Tax=Vanessa cardui TaxID=171605 RepID=UPI001F14699D|nr:uncharacterized protein LOC124542648 [Vanessa cardui]